MRNKCIEKLLCILCCLAIVLSSFVTVFADDYSEYDDDEDDNSNTVTYYIVEGEDFDNLFDFGIDDVSNLYDWILNFKTYTVIKKVDTDDDTYYYGYFNTPNLQQLAKNRVVSMIADGYTDSTYDVNETQRLVKVGEEAESDNIITRYGFDIPNYYYMGEYPVETMSIANIIPTSFLQGAWRAIKSLFGASFIEAPDADNFNTITYLNHGYIDQDNYLVDFIQKYYVKYFLARVATRNDSANSPIERYFLDVEDFIDSTVTEEEADSAEDYVDDNFEYYSQVEQLMTGYDNYEGDCGGSKINIFGLHPGMNAFSNIDFDDENTYNLYLGIGCDYSDIVIDPPSWWTGSLPSWASYDGEIGNPGDADPIYDDFEAWLHGRNRYMEAVRSWWNDESTYSKTLKAAFLQSIILNEGSDCALYSDCPHSWNSDGSALVAYFDGLFSTSDGTWDFIDALCIDYASTGTYYMVEYDQNGNEVRDDSAPISVYGLNMDPGEMDSSIRTDIGSAVVDVWPEPTPTPTATPSATPTPSPSTTPTPEPTPIPTRVYLDDTTVDGNSNHPVKYYYKVDDGTVSFDLRDVADSFLSIRIDMFAWQESDWVDPSSMVIYNKVEDCLDVVEDYIEFICRLSLLDMDSDGFQAEYGMQGIAYTQCLIPNTGEDGECENDTFGDEKTTITVGTLLGYSGLYQLTPDFSYSDFENHSNCDSGYWNNNPTIYESYERLTPEAANRIINYIKNYCGPYYSDVMGNIVKIICYNATNDEDDSDNPANEIGMQNDPRVMPFDIYTLLPKDSENYDVADPRVEKYKDTIIGTLITDLIINPAGILVYFRPQTTLLSCIGKITELSIFMQQLCNFDVLDEYGLSPTNMWTNSFALVLMGFLAVFFIFKTVKAVVNLCKTGSIGDSKIIIGFLLLVMELGFFTAMVANPDKIWGIVKNVDTSIMNVGEMATVYSQPDLTYLFGDSSDMEVTYYMPYLDAWSKYNTGYGILAPEQLLYTSSDRTDDTLIDLPETKEFENPHLYGNENIGHWSVILMDSFERHGTSNSTFYSDLYTDPRDGTVRVVNGTRLNNNVYRVVDHFMAPRVEFDEHSSESEIEITVTENENYNGEFQSGMADLIVKLLLALFMCFLSLLKLLTFFWQWYMFYIFFFKIILGRVEGKSWGQMLLQTFAPTAGCIMLGMYAGVILLIGMNLEGFVGVIIIIMLFLLTIKLLNWWYSIQQGAYFPGTMKWVVAFADMCVPGGGQYRRNRQYAERSDVDEEWKNMSIEQQYDYFYDENGNLKDTAKDRRTAYRRADVYDHFMNASKNGTDKSKFRNEHSSNNWTDEKYDRMKRSMEEYRESDYFNEDTTHWENAYSKQGYDKKFNRREMTNKKGNVDDETSNEEPASESPSNDEQETGGES